MSAQQATKQVEHVDVETMAKKFAEQEAERAKARIARRVERFKEAYGDPNSKSHKILMLKIKQRALRDQFQEMRGRLKGINGEIKSLRGNKKRNSSKKAESK